jgi:hypothetical protein
LFRTVAQTLLTIAADPQHLGAVIGFFAVLHTWGQNLLLHPHLHCVVPGGGLSPQGTWKACRATFFLPVKVLSRLFRRLFLEALEQAHASGQLHFYGDLEGLGQTAAFTAYLVPRSATRNGWSTPSPPSADRSMSSSISAATPIAWRFPTTGCWRWKTAKSRFAGRTIAMPARARL